MRQPLEKEATYEDLERLPENMVGEIIEGVLYALPRPAIGHGRIATTLGIDLGGPFDRGRGGPGGWLFIDEPELHLGRNVLVPDLAAWRRERLPELPAGDTPFLTLAPDWICEVLSPSTESIDRLVKRRIYARSGVSFFWLINPLARVLTAYRLERDHFVEIDTWGGDEDTRARVPPFDAIELELPALWPPPSATP